MKVGDLVTYHFQLPRWRKGQSVDVGLVVETGKYTGNCDVKVSWMGKRKAEVRTEVSQHLALVNNICLTSS